jgi:hypothetical protein
MDPEVKKIFIREVLEDASVHPLTKTWKLVRRGKKTWEDYRKEAERHILQGKDPDTAWAVAMVHLQQTLESKHPSARSKEFWETANRLTMMYEKQNEWTDFLLQQFHTQALQFAKRHPSVRRYPEFWRTLAGTVFRDGYNPESAKQIHWLAKKTATLYKDKELRGAIAEFAKTVEEILKKESEKNMMIKIEKERWANLRKEIEEHRA